MEVSPFTLIRQLHFWLCTRNLWENCKIQFLSKLLVHVLYCILIYKFFCYIVGFVGWADLPRMIHSRRSSWHTCCCKWTTWAPWTCAWCWIRSQHTPIFWFLLSSVFMQLWCWLWTKTKGELFSSTRGWHGWHLSMSVIYLGWYREDTSGSWKSIWGSHSSSWHGVIRGWG